MLLKKKEKKEYDILCTFNVLLFVKRADHENKKTKENKETKQFTISVKAIFSEPTYYLRQSINPYNTHLLRYIFP